MFLCHYQINPFVQVDWLVALQRALLPHTCRARGVKRLFWSVCLSVRIFATHTVDLEHYMTPSLRK